MKIFYSWQSDIPRKVGKDFIHAALVQAIETAKQTIDMTDAERDDIRLDQDTQGVLGSPEIARVIFDKISGCDLIVSDVTFVTADEANKRHINSNVAIELGYAYAKLTDERILKIMNIHYGEAVDLPTFDLRSRRFPVQFALSPSAGKEEIEKKRNQLANQHSSILAAYLERSTKTSKKSHLETQSTTMRGRFWQSNEPLIPEETSRNLPSVYWNGSSLLYFRCIPTQEMSELTVPEALDLAGNLRPLCSEHGFSKSRNKWGVISYDRSRNGNMLIGASQIFRNREIWGIDTTLAEAMTHGNDEDEEPKRFIAVSEIQSTYLRSIESIRKPLQHSGTAKSILLNLDFQALLACIFRPEICSKGLPGQYTKRKFFYGSKSRINSQPNG